MIETAYGKQYVGSSDRSTQSNTLDMAPAQRRSSLQAHSKVFQVKLAKIEWISLAGILVMTAIFVGMSFFWASQTKHINNQIEQLQIDIQEHKIETDAIKEEIINKTQPQLLENAAKEAGMIKDPSNIKGVSTNE